MCVVLCCEMSFLWGLVCIIVWGVNCCLLIFRISRVIRWASVRRCRRFFEFYGEMCVCCFENYWISVVVILLKDLFVVVGCLCWLIEVLRNGCARAVNATSVNATNRRDGSRWIIILCINLCGMLEISINVCDLDCCFDCLWVWCWVLWWFWARFRRERAITRAIFRVSSSSRVFWVCFL